MMLHRCRELDATLRALLTAVGDGEPAAGEENLRKKMEAARAAAKAIRDRVGFTNVKEYLGASEKPEPYNYLKMIADELETAIEEKWLQQEQRLVGRTPEETLKTLQKEYKAANAEDDSKRAELEAMRNKKKELEDEWHYWFSRTGKLRDEAVEGKEKEISDAASIGGVVDTTRRNTYRRLIRQVQYMEAAMLLSLETINAENAGDVWKRMHQLYMQRFR